jgi:hypothetical protein
MIYQASPLLPRHRTRRRKEAMLRSNAGGWFRLAGGRNDGQLPNLQFAAAIGTRTPHHTTPHHPKVLVTGPILRMTDDRDAQKAA